MHYIRPVINGAKAMVGIPKTFADPADEVVEVPKEGKKAASEFACCCCCCCVLDYS